MKSPLFIAALPASCQPSSPVVWPPSSQSLPTSAGVYIFTDSSNNAIYVGKAKNLRHRVSSYRLHINQVGKTKQLITTASHICWVELESDLQAIILEAHLIKTLTPKFNLRLKDDKSPLYIIITNERFPRVLTARKNELVNWKIGKLENWFGPFSSSAQVRKLLKYLRPAFPFCASTTRQKQQQQACFYFHLGICSGACTGAVGTRSYRAMIRRLMLVLSGEQDKVVRTLTRQMYRFSSQQKYEQASTARDQRHTIINLKTVNTISDFADEVASKTQQQKALIELQNSLHLSFPPRRIECYDIANLQGKHATGAMTVFVDGRPTPQQYRHFTIRTLDSPNDPGMIGEVITRRLQHPEWGTPDLMVIDGGISQVNAAKTAISHLSDAVPVIGLAKRDERIVTETGSEIHLPRHSPALQLLQHIRDEAHRFSRRLHHNLTMKDLLKSLKSD